MHRFYAPDLDPSRPTVALAADEARHLTRVLRLAPGAVVSVFDGKGSEVAARVEAALGNRVRLKILEPLQAVAESPLAMTLAQAVLKANKMDDVVRDAVMLGVTAIQPVVCSRAETSVAALRKARRVQRWQRVAVASAKQCGRARVPDVSDPVTLDAMLARKPGHATEMKLALVEPSQHQGRPLQALTGGSRPAALLVLIGPEGGWKPEEIAGLSAGGFQLVTLGSRTFRAEAAPLAVLTLLQFIWGDL